jgi:hypothetical protein
VLRTLHGEDLISPVSVGLEHGSAGPGFPGKRREITAERLCTRRVWWVCVACFNALGGQWGLPCRMQSGHCTSMWLLDDTEKIRSGRGTHAHRLCRTRRQHSVSKRRRSRVGLPSATGSSSFGGCCCVLSYSYHLSCNIISSLKSSAHKQGTLRSIRSTSKRYSLIHDEYFTGSAGDARPETKGSHYQFPCPVLRF